MHSQKDRVLCLLTRAQSLPWKENSMSVNYLYLQTTLQDNHWGTWRVHESHIACSSLVPERRCLASKAHVFPLNQAVSTPHNPWISLGTEKAEFPPAVVYGQAEQTTVKYTEWNVLINLLHSPVLSSTLFQLGHELGEVKSWPLWSLDWVKAEFIPGQWQGLFSSRHKSSVGSLQFRPQAYYC